MGFLGQLLTRLLTLLLDNFQICKECVISDKHPNKGPSQSEKVSH